MQRSKLFSLGGLRSRPMVTQFPVEFLPSLFGKEDPCALEANIQTLDTLRTLLALSVIPLGVVTRTVRSTIKETLSMEFVTALQAKGMSDGQILRHVLKNAAPTCLAVMGLQAGNLIGGSILIETVFAWPGTGFLLNSAIFRRDLPILQGTTLVLAFFFMMLNLTVDVIQTLVDPRIKRN